MPHVIKTNKLNIYLIKEKYRDYDSIVNLDIDDEIMKTEIGDIGVFYYKPSERKNPEWINSFFNNNGDIDQRVFSVSNARAIFIVKITYQRRSRFFAIPFGTGRFFLKNNCFEERFGLITTLNIIESNSIKAIDKRTISTNPKLSREQISLASEVSEFGIDFDTELIQSITGNSTANNKEFGSTVTGKAVLSITAKVDLTNIKVFLNKCYTIYLETTYKAKFGWIDKIKSIFDTSLINKLNDKLIKDINRKSNSIYVTAPESIDWSQIQGFSFSHFADAMPQYELSLNDFINTFNLNSNIDLEDLYNQNVTCWSNENIELFKWNIYECLNAEINFNSNKYILVNSQWFKINKSFVDKVNNEYNSIHSYSISLPDFDNSDTEEKDYNIKAAPLLNGQCLDRKLIPIGGGGSSIEFCDILTKSKELIHVKPQGGSSVLSHLFSQGHVSGELLLMDSDFRDKVKSKLDNGFKSLVTKAKPKTNDFKIIYAIITKNRNYEVPFFSKITLNYHKRVLEGYGYKVYLNRINNVKTN